jgi:DNA-binding NtrC family response regulator
MSEFLRYYLNLRKKALFWKRECLPALKNLEKDYIDYLLEVTQCNLSETAKILNISRTTLYHKIRKYKLIDRSKFL